MTIQLHNNVWDIIQFIVVILLKCPNYVIFKTRRTSKSLEQILKSIEELAQPGTNVKGCSYYNADGLWGDVCKSLEVPNTSVNQQKLYKAAAHLWKVFSCLSNDLITT